MKLAFVVRDDSVVCEDVGRKKSRQRLGSEAHELSRSINIHRHFLSY